MKKLQLFLIALLLCSFSYAQQKAQTEKEKLAKEEQVLKGNDLLQDVIPGGVSNFNYNKPVQSKVDFSKKGNRGLLFDNGPFVTNPGGGIGGADVSLLEPPNTSYGSNANFTGGFRMADDFTATESWIIDSLAFYGYQTNSPLSSTFTGLYIQIWNGDPSLGTSSVVWGDMTTNRMTSTHWTGCYRAVDLVGTTRPIMCVEATTTGLTLPAGDYWIEYAFTGSLTSGPWAPFISILGQIETGNSMQWTGAAWVDVVDAGSLGAKGLPFLVYGTTSSLLFNENFDYPVGDLLTAHGWTAHSGTSNFITTTAASITYPGYLSSGIGNEVSLVATGEDVNKTFDAQTSGSVYASCIINITSAVTDTGDYFFHLGQTVIGSAFRGRVFVKKDASSNLAFGIRFASQTSIPTAYTPFSYSLNTTYLLVVKYTFMEGTSNDVVSLFVNPVLGSSEPSPTVIATDVNTDITDIGSVALRQGSTALAPTLKLDGIRVGLTWEDIVGPEVILNPPTNLAAVVTGSDVHLTWDAPARALLGYNVYRDDVLLNTSTITDLFYDDLGLLPGTYIYTASAVYDEGESVPCAPVTVTVVPSEPVIYATDFEDFIAGQKVACQDSVNWDTWSYGPCGADDGLVTTDFSHSPVNSVKVNGNVDLLLLLGDKTAGAFELSWWMYVEADKAGYYNMQHFEIPGIEYAFQIYFLQNGNGELFAGASAAIPFTYPKATWFNVKHVIDVDNDWITLFVNDVEISSWPLSYTSFLTTGTKQLGGIDFYPGIKTGSGEIGQYYFDDVEYKEMAPVVLNPPTNLAGVATGQNVHLTWDEPGSERITWDNGTNYAAIGTNDTANFDVASRWPVSDIAPYDGMYLKKIVFFPNEASCTYTIKIWKGANASTLLYSQEVTSPIIGEFNEITLNTPVPIDGTDEFWFGYNVNATTGYPAGCDPGPQVAGKGNMIYWAGSWYELTALGASLTFNWNIQGLVSLTTAPGSLNQIVGTPQPSVMPVNKDVTSLFSAIKTQGKKFQPINGIDGSRALLGYNVYRDGTLLNTSVITDLFYDDLGLAPITYEYTATAVYDEGESVPTAPITVTVESGIYATDFEDFIADQKVACQDPINWTTWTNAPCGAEDALISTDFAHSGVNSVKDSGSNDLIFKMGDKTTGRYQFEFWMYIPTGKGGYYNLLQQFGATNKWGLEFIFTDAGTANLSAGGQTIPVAYTRDQWFKVTNIVDLDNDVAEVLLGGVSVLSWQWSLGASGSGGLNKLAAANFFSGTGAPGIVNPLYYFDDVDYSILAPLVLNPPRNLAGDAIGLDVHLTWEAPLSPNTFFEGFEGGTLPTGWLAIDHDGDGYNWENTIEAGLTVFAAHTGNGCMVSASYINAPGPGALTPDNWLITPGIQVTATSQLLYWHSAQDASYSDEHYYVRISTTTPDLTSFTDTIFDGVTPISWEEKSFDLSTYAGQTIYIAFQHCEVTDMYWMKLDDVTVTNTASRSLATPKITPAESKGYAFKTAGMSAEQIAAKQLELSKIKSARGLLGYNVYRDGTKVNTSVVTDLFYDDLNLAIGTYEYTATAVYNEGESEPVGPVMVTTGYCIAAAECDEYISNVTIGTINNSTECTAGGYADFSALSTNITAGTPEPITVVNGGPYALDECGIWVDWNNDYDFTNDDPIIVGGSPGVGPYTASIVVPAGVGNGSYRMRIRIVWNETPLPCGISDWGETEDYTLVVSGGATLTIPQVFTNPGPVSVPVHAKTITNMGAFQFSLEYDVTKMNYSGTSNWYTGITDVLVAEPSPGHLTFVWSASTAGVTIADDVFFNVNFNWSGSLLTSPLTWSDDPTPREFSTYSGGIFSPSYINGSVTGSGVNVPENGLQTIKVYPNPTSDIFSVKSDLNIKGIEMLSYIGQTVYSRKNVDSKLVQVDVSSLFSGVYFLKINTDQGIRTMKITVKH